MSQKQSFQINSGAPTLAHGRTLSSDFAFTAPEAHVIHFPEEEEKRGTWRERMGVAVKCTSGFYILTPPTMKAVQLSIICSSW